jgi:HAMP domain-containing protein
VRDALVITVLALVAIGAAALSFVAWHRLTRPGPPPEDHGGAQLDSNDPDV